MYVRINISKKGPRITQSIAACISLSKKKFEVQSFSLPIYENTETAVKKKSFFEGVLDRFKKKLRTN